MNSILERFFIINSGKKNSFFNFVFFSKPEFDFHSRTVISYKTARHNFYSNSIVSNAKHFGLYDSMDEDTLRSFQEFSLANAIFYAYKENSTSEQSARMSAMDNASKNAG